MAKVLLINGSPRTDGCTARALREMARVLEQEGLETEIFSVGTAVVRGCIACGGCRRKGACVFDDDPVNMAARKLEQADGLVLGTPVYYASPNGTLLSLMDRVMYSSAFSKHMKVGAAVVSARRGGCTASFDALNKYFTISGMVIAGSTYWNQVHGSTPQQVEEDLEGLQTMRNLARNMAFLIRAIAAEKAARGLPEMERTAVTGFHHG